MDFVLWDFSEGVSCKLDSDFCLFRLRNTSGGSWKSIALLSDFTRVDDRMPSGFSVLGVEEESGERGEAIGIGGGVEGRDCCVGVGMVTALGDSFNGLFFRVPAGSLACVGSLAPFECANSLACDGSLI